MVEPHGGKLVNRLVQGEEASRWKSEVRSLSSVTLNARQMNDLHMLAIGALSPLEGFMTRRDYESVVRDMHLVNGLPWSMPITLAVGEDVAKNVKESRLVALYSPSGQLAAVLHLDEIYGYDKELEARNVFRTTDTAHPGAQNLYSQGEMHLGGRVAVLHVDEDSSFGPYNLIPAQSRALFAQKGWKTVVGFQTRNPIHRAHEFIQKCALEIVDGLFVHPLVGETKKGDIPANVRMRCYQALLENYYPKDRVVLGVMPAFMRYAGPREAIFHALVRKNYGCTHFIVGRDHAGVGNYYGPYDAQHIFSEFKPGELGITPLFFENAFYCKRCDGMATSKTCPHPESDHVSLSGTQVRAMLARGEVPPPHFTRPEVARVLIEAMAASEA